MVQEVRIQTATYDAAIGHTTGGSLSISLKAGTNDLHGTVGGFISKGPMLTRNFFTNLWIFDPNTGTMKERFPHTALISCAGGYQGYLPLEYEYARGGYEASERATHFEPGTADRLLDAVLDWHAHDATKQGG